MSASSCPARVQHAEHQREPHDDVVVAPADRLEVESPHSRPGENLFENDGAAEEPRQRESSSVTNGISVLRKACFQMMVRGATPLARAVRM